MKGFFKAPIKIPATTRSHKAASNNLVFNCDKCTRNKMKKEGRLDPSWIGKGEKGIVVVLPLLQDVEQGQGLVNIVRSKLRQVGVDLNRDCILTGTVDCLYPVYMEPKINDIKCCYSKKLDLLSDLKPKIILLMGESTISFFYGCDVYRRSGCSSTKGGLLGMQSLRGKVIPDKVLKAWVLHTYSPVEIDNETFERVFDLDLKVFGLLVNDVRLEKPDFSFMENPGNIITLTKFEDVMSLLDDIYTAADGFSFDYETSSFRYYENIHSVHMISMAFSNKKAYVFPFEMDDINGKPWWNTYQMTKIAARWRDVLRSSAPKNAHNIKHEEKVSKYLFGVNVNNWSWDSMLAAHVLDESKGVKGLKQQVFFNWGITYGSEINSYLKAQPHRRNNFENAPFKESALYCGRDSMFTHALSTKQKHLIDTAGMRKAYQLLHDGTLAFAKMEESGIRLDIIEMQRQYNEWGDNIKVLKDKIMSSDEVAKFVKIKKRFPKYHKEFSSKDLQYILFDIMKLTPTRHTKTGYSVDEQSLFEFKNSELVSNELECRKLESMRKFLHLFLTLHVDGYIYPSFNLHIPRSYRSSSSEPNFQNIPKRDNIASVIRRLIIARNGNKLLCGDYSSMEVRILACASGDEVLIDYLRSGIDPHGDWAKELFMVDDRDERWDFLRYKAKNGFVFPEFYGSWYKSIARNIEPLNDFFPNSTKKERDYKWEKHVQRVEHKFWKKFRGVREWQNSKMDIYAKKGYVQDDAWGFCRRGNLTRNKIFNFPIQGPAFHCLLWSIIEYYKRKIHTVISDKSVLCAQIHDEVFFDLDPSDINTIKKEMTQIMSVDIRKEHKWLVVPLEVGWTEGKNWNDMEKGDKQ